MTPPADGLFDSVRAIADLLANVWQLGYVTRIESSLADSNLKIDYTVLIPGRVRAGYVDTSADCQLQP